MGNAHAFIRGKMKIYCLIENTKSSDDFVCEHGLSFFIDTGTRKILFDMGQSDAFIKNAKRLGLDLSQVDFAILSHGHFDHGGGLKAFLEINKKAPVYVSKHGFEPHYNKDKKYIGLDTSIQSDRIIFVDKTTNIDTGISILNCNDKKAQYKIDTFGQTVLENEVFTEEDYRHEQYLMIDVCGKRILFTGCSHKGILNIVNWIEADYIIGGFHFFKMEIDKILEICASYLGTFDCQFFTCHCTGKEQYEFMKEFAQNIKYISSGDIIEF